MPVGLMNICDGPTPVDPSIEPAPWPPDTHITGLTGGGSTNLDGVSTTGLTTTTTFKSFLLNGSLVTFQLRAGLFPGSPDVHPVDYNASTNAKYWRQVL